MEAHLVVEQTVSNRNEAKISFLGYLYVRKYIGKFFITWRCAKSNSCRCNVRLRTSLDGVRVLQDPGHHSAHPRDSQVCKNYNVYKPYNSFFFLSAGNI